MQERIHPIKMMMKIEIRRLKGCLQELLEGRRILVFGLGLSTKSLVWYLKRNPQRRG